MPVLVDLHHNVYVGVEGYMAGYGDTKFPGSCKTLRASPVR